LGFAPPPSAANRPDHARPKKAVKAAKAEGATRAQFADMIAIYPRKYIKSEQVLRERTREDSARLEKLWKLRRT